MNSLRALFTRRSNRPSIMKSIGRRRPAFQPRVEALEERMVLNNRFVIPAGPTVDNVVNFATLQSALITPGHTPGEVIQIEPGSTPGAVTGAGLIAPGVMHLTIQGEPAATLSAVPQFTLIDVASLGFEEDGFALKHVNVGLTNAGALQFEGSTTITGSSIVDINSTAMVMVQFNPVGNNVANSVTGSSLINAGSTVFTVGIKMLPSNGTGNSNVFMNNTFSANNANLSQGISCGMPRWPVELRYRRHRIRLSITHSRPLAEPVCRPCFSTTHRRAVWSFRETRSPIPTTP